VNSELKIGMMEENIKYEEALAQLETIVRKMEQNEYNIDELAAQLKTAQRLIKFCKDKLTKTEEELQKIQAEANS
jgi:exodeoxyribonuclease VII small subunit